MTSNGANNGITSLNASDSDIPSIANSLQNLTSSKQTLSQQPPQSPDPEQFIAELLEKAKFYTSLCLGKWQFGVWCGDESHTLHK